MVYLVKTKYSTAKKQTYSGKLYHSGFEANHARDLDLLVKAGEIKSWERQVKIPLIVNGMCVANYYIDFVVHHNNGDTEYVETKGYAFPEWKLKWKVFEALYSNKPGVFLTVVKQKNNWYLRKIKKVKYGGK